MTRHEMKNGDGETVGVLDDGEDDENHAEQLRQMWDEHVKLGRKAVAIALKVLDKVNPDDVPVQVAVQLLKFGVEVERRALLGVETEGDGEDPFEALAKAAAEAEAGGTGG